MQIILGFKIPSPDEFRCGHPKKPDNIMVTYRKQENGKRDVVWRCRTCNRASHTKTS